MHGLTGEWVGDIWGPAGAEYIRLVVQAGDGPIEGTVEFPLKIMYTGTAEPLPLQNVQASATQLRFEVQREAGGIAFDLATENGTLTGTVVEGGEKRTAQLMRVSSIDALHATEYVGMYVGTPGRAMGVQQDRELVQQLLVLDYASGRLRALFPTSPTTFVSGPSFLVPWPVEDHIKFRREQENRVAGFEVQSDAGRMSTEKHALRTEEVRFSNGNTTLAGTLVMPPGPGPHPAVVLLHGAAGGERNGLLGYLAFHAAWFAYNGIAALTYDRRGSGGSTEGSSDLRLFDLADDGVAASRYLAARGEIDAERIGFWGLSQGGWLAPLAAVRAGTAAFVLTVSGPGTSPAEQEVYRVEHVLRADGFPEEEVKAATSLMRRKFEVAFTGEGWDELEAAVQDARSRAWLPFVFAPESPEDLATYRTFPMDYDPVPTWRQLRCPVLAIFGERDMDIPVEASVAKIDSAQRAAGNTDYTIEVVAAADHLIMPSVTGGFTHLPLAQGYAPSYFPTMAEWLRQRAKVGYGSKQ
jgi:uncharacterized protein